MLPVDMFEYSTDNILNIQLVFCLVLIDRWKQYVLMNVMLLWTVLPFFFFVVLIDKDLLPFCIDCFCV